MFFLIVILLRPPLFRPSQLTRSSTPARPADRSRSSPLLEGAPVSPFFGEPRHISPLSTFTQSFAVKFVRTTPQRLVRRSTPGSHQEMTSSQENAVTVNSLPPKEMRTVTAFPT
jgi:hypothetical protein